VAVFADLRVNGLTLLQGVTLRATSAGLPNVDSTPFSVSIL
jgi:hypothetical protein